MSIQNIIPNFLSSYESTAKFKMEELHSYINSHQSIFEQYFPMHCPQTEERLNEALTKYPAKIADIRTFSDRMPTIIHDIESLFQSTFDLNLNLTYKLIVGTFGSNAFVTRDNKREIYFAAEKLSPEIDHLKVIVAHEIGHVAHFSFATKKGMDWGTINWMHGLTTLFLEGAATYLSKKIVPHLDESIYYSFDDEGEKWLDFYKENRAELKRRFLEDASTDWNMTKEREWFRLSGGNYFGFNRLGYFLGADYMEDLVKKEGEEVALTYWHGKPFHENILRWLST